MEPVNSPAPSLRPNPDVIARQMGEGAILVHLLNNQVFELNHTGARVWELIGQGTPFNEIIQTLATEFDMDPAGVTADVNNLIAWLRDENLLQS